MIASNHLSPRFPSAMQRPKFNVRASQSASEYPFWKDLTAKQQLKFVQDFEEATKKASEAVRAKESVENQVELAELDKKLIEMKMKTLKLTSEHQHNKLERSLGGQINTLTQEITEIMAYSNQLSFNGIIDDVEHNCLSVQERYLHFKDRWIIIFSKKPGFFQALKSCNENWTKESDITDVIIRILEETKGFKHCFFMDLNSQLQMDFPRHIATDDVLRLAGEIATEAGYPLVFCPADEDSVDEEDVKIDYFQLLRLFTSSRNRNSVV